MSKSTVTLFLFCFLLQEVVHNPAHAQYWWNASRESAGLAPDPATTPEAIIQVYGAKACS